MNNCVVKDGELYHYGGLGMKWGIHRARNKGQSYTYKSHGQKKWERKINKYQNAAKKKIDKFETPDDKKKFKAENSAKITRARNKLETFQKRDRNRQRYTESTTIGRTIAKGILLGPFGAGQYNRLRASGDTRIAAFKKSNIFNSTLNLPMSVITTRNEEFRSAR